MITELWVLCFQSAHKRTQISYTYYVCNPCTQPVSWLQLRISKATNVTGIGFIGDTFAKCKLNMGGFRSVVGAFWFKVYTTLIGIFVI